MNETVTPDTMNYLILGLIVTAAIVALFIGSMVARYRNLQKDLQTLEQLRDDK
jgi:cell division protein FtsL